MAKTKLSAAERRFASFFPAHQNIHLFFLLVSGRELLEKHLLTLHALVFGADYEKKPKNTCEDLISGAVMYCMDVYHDIYMTN
jgi:hypothetical protein